MNRIEQLVKQKRDHLLSLYFCAGHPTLDGTKDTIIAIEKAGIDFIEIGIPFSDPLADGPIIQAASVNSLKNGMSLRKLFCQLKDIRKEVSLPLILMGYLNPILQYGFKNFCEKCNECGIDGLIIPDLPLDEYIESYKPIADQYGLYIIMLITPETSEERIRKIDHYTNGFIYMVSSASTTGAQKQLKEKEYFNRINAMNLKHPRIIGFGISNKTTLETAQKYSNGAIIGSKFVSLLDKMNSAPQALKELFDCLNKEE